MTDVTVQTQRSGIETQFSKAEALLKLLVPRASTFGFYNRLKECIWRSDDGEDGEIDNLITGLPDDLIAKLTNEREILQRTLKSGRAVIALPVYTDDTQCIGLLVVLFSRDVIRSASFSANAVIDILDPAIDVIAESLQVKTGSSSVDQRTEDGARELDVVYEIDEIISRTSGRHSALAQIVGRSGRYLEIKYSVLLIPGKRIRISAAHSSWKAVNRKALDHYLIERLLPKLDRRRSPVIFELSRNVETGDPAADCQVLVCPIYNKHGVIEGVFAQLGRIDGQNFTRSDRRFMSYIGRKVEYVIEQSFDSMTGFMNRSSFEAQLRESSNSLNSSQDTHQVVYFDLDNLQLVNDTFGRKAGDDVIREFARLLNEDLPKSGVLSRLTGDDFCLLLTHASSEAALTYANRVREKTTAMRYLEGDKSLQVTISVGISELCRENSDSGAALTTARMACEAAKAHGRNRVEIFEEGNLSAVRRFDDMQVVANIQRALDDDGLDLLAQPIASLKPGRHAPYYEVLLRVADDQGDQVSTEVLFSAAERYNLMPRIDRWVVSNTIARLAQVTRFVENEPAVFSINLSGQSLSDDEFLNFLLEKIAASGLPASTLGFEITESAAVSNLAKAQAFIDRLSEIGCKILLDDFGAGLSSFAYLRDFNVDVLKIDGSFVRDIVDNRISESMVAAITQVAKVMELETVAEYVETAKARKLLEKLGVDYAQGYAIGKPVPLDAVLSELSAVLSSTA